MTFNKLWLFLGRLGYFPAYPLAAIYLLNSNRVRIILRHENKILVVKPWLNNGRWDLPGGGLYKGEDRIQGALRELKEELGVEIDDYVAECIFSERFKSGLLRYQAHYIDINLKSLAIVSRLQKHEISEFMWINKEDINSLPMISGRMNEVAIHVLTKRK